MIGRAPITRIGFSLLLLALTFALAAGSGSNAQRVLAANPPTITSISPTSGAAGTGVTITGTNFVPGQTTATFGSVPVAATCSNTTCTTVAPAQAAGTTTVQVTVSTPNGTSNAVSFSYGSGSAVTI